jgi:hypothetical protein
MLTVTQIIDLFICLEDGCHVTSKKANCILPSLLFSDIVLLCVTVFFLYTSLIIVLLLYWVCLWSTFCYPNCGFSVPFPQFYGKCQDITRKDGARSALPKIGNSLLLYMFNFQIVLYIYIKQSKTTIYIYIPFSVFCVFFCVKVYCTAATGCQPNCS